MRWRIRCGDWGGGVLWIAGCAGAVYRGECGAAAGGECVFNDTGTIVLAAVFQAHIRADYRVHPSWKGWLFVALAGGASTWGVTFWFLALGEAPAILVAPLAATHPLFSVLLTLVFLRGLERVTVRTVVGTLLVIAGVALITLGIE